MRYPRIVTRTQLLTAIALIGAVLLGPSATDAATTSTPTARISGDGSSWAGNALGDWVAAIKAQGVTVDYTPNGSSSGRKNFAQGLSDFTVSEIPYTGDTADPQDSSRPNFGYAMLPVVAGGTSFMYNLPVNGSRYTALKLSQSALAKIFSGQITQWNDKQITKTNPGVNLPAQRITVVVRSDGSGATAQFTLWMKRQFGSAYAALCKKAGCNPNAATSYFPTQNMTNFTGQSGSNGVTTYTANTPYTINYDEYSYALGVNFPVAQIQNAAGFFTVPTAEAVAVALTQAKINHDKKSLNYLSQDLSKVYGYRDPRSYPISAYSYMIEPTQTHGNFNTSKGNTLSYFETFALCEGQRTMGALGYSPLPMNLVLDAMDQVTRVPGISADTLATIKATKAGVTSGNSNPCNNPTFRPGDSPAHNLLTDTAPFPAGCDASCQAPWIRAGSSGPKDPTNSGGGTDGPSNSPNSGRDTGSGDPGSGADGPAGGGSQTGPGNGTSNQGPGGGSGPAGGCDPDTGQCGTTTGTTPADSTVIATPTVLASSGRWGTTEVALLISAICALGLILVPPLAARRFAGRGSSAPTDSP